MTDRLPPGCTLVALPYVSKQGFTGATVRSLIEAVIARGIINAKFAFFGDHSQVQARNAACRATLECGADWLFFIDSDMDFPVDTLPRLKACDADIACTDMWSRNWPSFRTVMRFGEKDGAGMAQSIPVPTEVSERGLVEDVDLCGMACTLIKRSLIERMAEKWPTQPWFWVAEHGEDAMFCFKAKEMGASIRCDFGIVAGHWGVCRMAGQDFTRDARNQTMNLENMEMMRHMGVTNLPDA